MNLHALASGAIRAVNPMTTVTIQQSAGNTIAADGVQTPTYNTFTGIQAQIQPLTAQELQLVETLAIQGQMKACHIDGDWQGVVRADGKGGDLIQFAGQVWLIVQVFETWPDWCRVAICRQS